MKSIRNLIAAIALIAITVSVSAQAFVVPTASFTPVSTGNSVWVTKSDAGKPAGSIYARGYTSDWSAVVDWFAMSGTTVLWKWENNHLFLTSFASAFPTTGGMYLCPPPQNGNRLALQVTTTLGTGTAVGQGALRAPLGFSLIVPTVGQNSGYIDFPGNATQQVWFRVVTY